MSEAAQSSGEHPAEGPGGPGDDLRAGLVIAERYRLERPIGTGGMATIWEATHLALNRSIAVKFVDIVGRSTAKVRERFLREARVAAAIRHRNVVDIIDFGTTPEGRPYMAMELLVGRTLADVMDRGPALTVGESVRMAARMLSGLAAVHDAGIVHRDLKPENVFLVQDADGTYPKLLDFGVSRAVDPQGELESVLPTRENAIVGTPQYMSPEQARGLANIDHRSDIWSAGVILYELLTGKLPFDADAVGDVIIQIATEDPPPFASLRPDLAGPLEEVIERAMSKKPEKRFESAREMRSFLLAAAAQTAAAIQGRAGSRRVSVDTHSDVPPVAAQELMSAVGDVYEPGDSGLIDFSEHLHLLDAPEEEPISGLRVVPPPLGLDASPFPTRRDTLGDTEAIAPRRSRAPLFVGLGVVLLAAVAGGGYVAMGRPSDPFASASPPTATATPSAGAEGAEASPEAPSPEPVEAGSSETGALEGEAAPTAGDPVADSEAAALPANVTITLRGVPPRSRVTVDGRLVRGPIELPRDDAEHAIEVRRLRRAWSVVHVASADGEYDVRLRPMPRGRRTGPTRATGSTSGGSRPTREQGGLMRNPGF